MTPGSIPFRVRVGHAAIHHPSHPKRAADPTCNRGFYISPTSGQIVKTSEPVNITWNPTCLNSTAVDIYVYAPGANQSRIHLFQKVNNALGNYQAPFKPKWWNATQSINLQLAIVEYNTPPFLAPFAAAPVFSATYTPPTSGPVPPDADVAHPENAITFVNNFGTVKSGGLSKGSTAAAVIMPLLIVAVAVAAYVKWTRMKVAKKRERFSQVVDKRMSTISTDWRSLSAAGAEAAIRHSMAVSANRASTASFGAPRPASSIYAVESGQAGIGSGNNGPVSGDASGDGEEQMSQIRRPGVGPRGGSVTGADRVSRISFAADTRFSRANDPRPSGETSRSRPSLESRRAGAATRSFHTSVVPPLPTRQDSGSNGSDSDVGTMSPTQTQGPLALSPDDIRARIAGHPETRPSLDEVMPALSMMRTGGGNASTNDLLLTQPSSPPPALPALPPAAAPKSPIANSMPMQAMPAMSPDAMLRAYAERRAAPGSPSFPPAAAAAGRNTMRTLYSPTAGASDGSVSSPTVGSNNPFRESMAVDLHRQTGEFDNEDAYALGTAE